MTRPLTIMLVAGEASGDQLGAGLAWALRRRLGENGVRLVGVGGARMAEAGVHSAFDYAELSVLGFVEGVRAYPRVVRRADETAALAERELPDIAVLIDSWGFTLRVAQRLRRRLPGMPIVKYVGPQVWASRPGRARTLAATVDHLLSIHRFGQEAFQAAGLPTTFVGWPALRRDLSGADGLRLRARLGIPPDAPLLLVLPGSRAGEVGRMGPPFGEAVGRLRAERPALAVVVAAAEPVANAVRTVVAGWPGAVHVVEGEEARLDAMAACTVALACSGTVTTEAALAGAPLVVGYRVGALSAVLIRAVMRTRWITLINVAAGREVAPEFVQERCTGARLADTVAERLDDPALRARQVAEQNAALDSMGRIGPDPSEAAADAVLHLLRRRAPA